MPLAFLALVPSGLVSRAGCTTSAAPSPPLFPVRPTIDAMRSALYGDGSLIGPLLHLLGLTIAFGAAARAALIRFATA